MNSHFFRAPLLVAVLSLVSWSAANAADGPGERPRAVDPVKRKAQDADKARLLAKLRGEAPKVREKPPLANALDAPIFHRYDKR